MAGFTGLKYEGVQWTKDRYAPGDGDISMDNLEADYEAAKWGTQEPDMLLVSPEYWNKTKKTLYNITFVRDDLVVYSEEELVDGRGEW